MWRPLAARGPGAGRFVRCLGPLPLCAVLLVQADRNETSDRCLGSAAESTLSGMGRPCRWALVAREGRGSVERVEIFEMRIIPRRFTPVCPSRCSAGGADRGPGAGRFRRALGSLPLCVVLLAHLALAPSPSRPLGAGRRGGELHTQSPRPPTPPPSLLSVLRTGVWVRVRGVIRLRSTPNGLERDQRTKNDFRSS